MNKLEIKANAEQYALKTITSSDLFTRARDKILIQDAYEKGFNDCYEIVKKGAELREKQLEELEKENAELNEQNRSYEQLIDTGSVTLMKDRLKNYKQLTKAKEIIKKLYSHVFQGMGFMEINDYNVQKAEVEQFLEEIEQ